MKMDIKKTAIRVSHDIDDVLATVPLVIGNKPLTDELFEHLVDLLVQSTIVGFAREWDEGALTDDQYVEAMATFAHECHQIGLITGT